jgi:hypothetical protein
MEGLTFVADFDYERKNDTELSFEKGDTVRITANQDGWFYGQHTKSGLMGWLAPSYGHTRQDSPYSKLTGAAKSDKRDLLFRNILAAEHEFTTLLSTFIQEVINPINLRDTPFKRSFLNDASVAVSFSLLQELYKACFNFESVITASKSDIELSNAYIQFSPSLQIFAQYASENAKLLNAIKSSSRQLAEVVPEKVDIVQLLIQPMQHVPLYKSLFQEYLWLSSGTPDYGALETALEMISSQTLEVEARIKEEEESWKLLTLQSQCTCQTSVRPFPPSFCCWFGLAENCL